MTAPDRVNLWALIDDANQNSTSAPVVFVGLTAPATRPTIAPLSTGTSRDSISSWASASLTFLTALQASLLRGSLDAPPVR